MEPTKAAIYSRISREETGSKKAAEIGTVKQDLLLREFCERQGMQVAMAIEETVSGVKGARPGRDKVFRAARVKEIDAVVVWKLDRWGRSMSDLIMTLEEMHHWGIRFISLTEALDFDSPAGRLQVHMLAAFAQFEYDMIAERSAAGVKRARDRGVQFGRPRTASYHTEKIKALRVDGLSMANIAKRLQISKASVCRILKTVEVGE